MNLRVQPTSPIVSMGNCSAFGTRNIESDVIQLPSEVISSHNRPYRPYSPRDMANTTGSYATPTIPRLTRQTSAESADSCRSYGSYVSGSSSHDNNDLFGDGDVIEGVATVNRRRRRRKKRQIDGTASIPSGFLWFGWKEDNERENVDQIVAQQFEQQGVLEVYTVCYACLKPTFPILLRKVRADARSRARVEVFRKTSIYGSCGRHL